MSSLVDIDSKGYGKIFKLVMRDRSLPLLAKTIYAYFCAYTGCGCHTFPKRDKVLHDLQINKDTFTKHLNLLVEGRYISKERTGTGNVYTILQRIPVYAETLEVEQGQSDMLVFENAAAHGFGTYPQAGDAEPAADTPGQGHLRILCLLRRSWNDCLSPQVYHYAGAANRLC